MISETRKSAYYIFEVAVANSLKGIWTQNVWILELISEEGSKETNFQNMQIFILPDKIFIHTMSFEYIYMIIFLNFLNITTLVLNLQSNT